MVSKYINEKDGQIKFFDSLKISADVAITDNTDGVYKGTLFEFKLTIPNINKVLFQAIKYLSHMRIKGESVPKNIMLVALNEERAYVFESASFLQEIETIYAGAASKNNNNFSTSIKPKKIDYSKISGLEELAHTIQNEGFTKVHIDIYDVVGWANRFYSEKPKASKKAFFKEISQPSHFKGLIYAWRGKESDFKYVMDLLNDKVHRKDLGAFYTPPAYCKKALSLVRRAIRAMPDNHKYIIVDRCAGTGNLEAFMTDKEVADITVSELHKYMLEKDRINYLKDKRTVIQMLDKAVDDVTMQELEAFKTNTCIYDYLTDNELSHCVVATYELKEWIVLNERIGHKVKMVIPPSVDPTEGLVNGGDALACEIFSDIKPFIDSPDCNIIMLENPPYSDVGAVKNNSASATKRTAWKNSLLHKRMSEDVRGRNDISKRAVNDLANVFIWSAFKYYLTKTDDYYVLFSPPKYFKSQNLISKKFIDGYIFNRKYFHANSASAITCILWQNLTEDSKNEYALSVENIVGQDPWNNEADTERIDTFEVKTVHYPLSKMYDKYSPEQYPDDQPGIILAWDGTETNKRAGIKAIYNDNIVGYLVAQDFGFEHPRLSTNLVRTGVYAGHGFFLRDETFLAKLPLFCAGKFDAGTKWWLMGTIFKSADGGAEYENDSFFIKRCLIYTCLSYYNKCLSFIGTDGRLYLNKLCFDKGTLAQKTLKQMSLEDDDKLLLDVWKAVQKEAVNTKNYNKSFVYGVYQIEKELNTYKRDENTGDKLYDYPALNTKLIELKNKLNSYYNTKILPSLFEYELLK